MGDELKSTETAFLTSEERGAIASRLAEPKFELIPLKNVLEQAEHLPAGATVSVTASPAKDLEATLDLSEQLLAGGFTVIPHFAARMVRDEDHLRALLDRAGGLGIDRLFVIGGDAEEPGDYFDALSLLEAMTRLEHPFTEIGVGCYPDGHGFIPDDKLQEALAAKQSFAHYMTTQMCFDPQLISRWVAASRQRGIHLPIYLGLPGVAELRKLMQISVRIGVRDSSRFLKKNPALIGKLVRPGGYSPDGLIESMAQTMLDPEANIRGFHIYTFNQVESTERWRASMLSRLDVET